MWWCISVASHDDKHGKSYWTTGIPRDWKPKWTTTWNGNRWWNASQKQNKRSWIRPRTNFETGKGILSETYYIMPYTQRTKIIEHTKNIETGIRLQQTAINSQNPGKFMKQNSYNSKTWILRAFMGIFPWSYSPPIFLGDRSPEMHAGISPGLRVQLHPDWWGVYSWHPEVVFSLLACFVPVFFSRYSNFWETKWIGRTKQE